VAPATDEPGAAPTTAPIRLRPRKCRRLAKAADGNRRTRKTGPWRNRREDRRKETL